MPEGPLGRIRLLCDLTPQLDATFPVDDARRARIVNAVAYELGCLCTALEADPDAALGQAQPHPLCAIAGGRGRASLRTVAVDCLSLFPTSAFVVRRASDLLLRDLQRGSLPARHAASLAPALDGILASTLACRAHLHNTDTVSAVVSLAAAFHAAHPPSTLLRGDVATHVVTNLLSVLRHYFGQPRVVAPALQVLRAICAPAASATLRFETARPEDAAPEPAPFDALVSLRDEACACILALLRSPGIDARSLEAGCAVLASIADAERWVCHAATAGLREDVWAAQSLLEAGAVPAVVAALRTCVADGAVVEACCMILRRIAGVGADAQHAVAEAGALSALAQALAVHTRAPELLQAVCRTVYDIVLDNDATAAVAGMAGLVEAFVSVLLCPATAPAVRKDAAWAFERCILPDVPGNAARALAVPSLIPRLVTLLRQHGSACPQLAETLCWALQRLAVGRPAVQWQLVEAGALTVVGALPRHTLPAGPEGAGLPGALLPGAFGADLLQAVRGLLSVLLPLLRQSGNGRNDGAARLHEEAATRKSGYCAAA
jgi:hypothetical protein